jgi:hypothetical protein
LLITTDTTIRESRRSIIDWASSAPRMFTGHRKGKAVDKSSPWTEHVWHEGGYWVSSRYGPSGEFEYDFRYPDTPTLSHQNQDETPRAQGEREEMNYTFDVQESLALASQRFTDPKPITEVEMRKAKGFSGFEEPENENETMYE